MRKISLKYDPISYCPLPILPRYLPVIEEWAKVAQTPDDLPKFGRQGGHSVVYLPKPLILRPMYPDVVQEAHPYLGIQKAYERLGVPYMLTETGFVTL